MTSLALRNTRTSVLDRQPTPAFWLVETLWLMMAAMAQTHNRFSMMEQVMGGGLGLPPIAILRGALGVASPVRLPAEMGARPGM